MREGWRGRRIASPREGAKWKRVDKRGDKRASVEGARVLAALENSCVKRNRDGMNKGVESLKWEREEKRIQKKKERGHTVCGEILFHFDIQSSANNQELYTNEYEFLILYCNYKCVNSFPKRDGNKMNKRGEC